MGPLYDDEGESRYESLTEEFYVAHLDDALYLGTIKLISIDNEPMWVLVEDPSDVGTKIVLNSGETLFVSGPIGYDGHGIFITRDSGNCSIMYCYDSNNNLIAQSSND